MKRLKEYRKKRDFERTAEPAGASTKTSKKPVRRAATSHSFVVHKHAASHLHYDFRIEHAGILLSWAIPKGPSLDPSVKRLAVQVEDHPLEYGAFEGTIAKGQYGAGSVIVWDRGTWSTAGDVDEDLRRGKLAFELDGERLRGSWKLVRMAARGEAKPQWLLMKADDAEARPDARTSIVDEHVTSVVSGLTVEEVAQGRASRRTAKLRAKKPANKPTKNLARKAATKKSPSTRSRARTSRVTKRRTLPRCAVRGPLPKFVAPQLARLLDAVPEGDAWLHEVKLDGYRMQVRIEGSRVTWTSRNELDWSATFGHFDAEVASLRCESALLDVEVVALRDDGTSSFSDLQAALSEDRIDDLVVYAFDILHLDGSDLRECPTIERKSVLEQLLPSGKDDRLRYSAHSRGRGAELLPAACARDLEGIVSKRADAPYTSGRDGTWVKTKCVHEQEFVVVGWSPSAKARSGIGALLLAHRVRGKLTTVGMVGSGIDARSAERIAERLRNLERKSPPPGLVDTGSRKDLRWVRPQLVAQIAFAGWTGAEQVRHARFLGLRDDKSARDVVRERATARDRGAAREIAVRSKVATQRSTRKAVPIAAKRSTATSPTVTHPDRVVDEESGATKLDVALFVARYADRLLKHIADRPVSLMRCPAGVGAKCFFQRHANRQFGADVDEVDVGDGQQYVIVHDAKGLSALVQMNVLEFHPWGSAPGDPDRPDRMVFDLDPGPNVAWSDVIDAARIVRELLQRLELDSLVKSSGGKGFHVVVPLTGTDGWETVSAFSRAVAEQLVKQDDQFVATASKKLRTGRIFVDYLRNKRGSTTVAPWSPRARAGLPISVPLSWASLGRARSADATQLAELTTGRLRSDPWVGWSRIRQRLPRTGRVGRR